MTDRNELLLLADKCRSLAAATDDEATVRSLDRLADEYRTRADILDYLAKGRVTSFGRSPAVRPSAPAPAARQGGTPGPEMH